MTTTQMITDACYLAKYQKSYKSKLFLMACDVQKIYSQGTRHLLKAGVNMQGGYNVRDFRPITDLFIFLRRERK